MFCTLARARPPRALPASVWAASSSPCPLPELLARPRQLVAPFNVGFAQPLPSFASACEAPAERAEAAAFGVNAQARRAGDAAPSSPEEPGLQTTGCLVEQILLLSIDGLHESDLSALIATHPGFAPRPRLLQAPLAPGYALFARSACPASVVARSHTELGTLWHSAIAASNAATTQSSSASLRQSGGSSLITYSS